MDNDIFTPSLKFLYPSISEGEFINKYSSSNIHLTLNSIISAHIVNSVCSDFHWINRHQTQPFSAVWWNPVRFAHMVPPLVGAICPYTWKKKIHGCGTNDGQPSTCHPYQRQSLAILYRFAKFFHLNPSVSLSLERGIPQQERAASIPHNLCEGQTQNPYPIFNSFTDFLLIAFNPNPSFLSIPFPLSSKLCR